MTPGSSAAPEQAPASASTPAMDPLEGVRAAVNETIDLTSSAMANGKTNGSSAEHRINKRAGEPDQVAQIRAAIIADKTFTEDLATSVANILRTKTLWFCGAALVIFVGALSFVIYEHLPAKVESAVATALTEDRARSVDQSNQIGALAERVRQSESGLGKLDEILTTLAEIKTESKLRFESTDTRVKEAVSEFRESLKTVDARVYQLITGSQKQSSLINLAERMTVAQAADAEVRRQIHATSVELSAEPVIAGDPRTTAAVAAIIGFLSDAGRNADVDRLRNDWHQYSVTNLTLAKQFLRHYGWDAIGTSNGQPPLNHEFYSYANVVRSLGHEAAVLPYELTLAFAASPKAAEYATDHVKSTFSGFVKHLTNLESESPRDAELAAQEFLTPFCKNEQTVDPKSSRSEVARTNLRRFATAYKPEFQQIARIGGVHLNALQPESSSSADGYTTASPERALENR